MTKTDMAIKVKKPNKSSTYSMNDHLARNKAKGGQIKSFLQNSTFHNLIVLSFVDSINNAPFAEWLHLILFIFSSISRLLR
jgi:hypothetical protein